MAAARYIAISTPAVAPAEVSGAGLGSHADAGDGRQYRPEHAADVRAEEDARIGEAALHAEGRHQLLGEERKVLIHELVVVAEDRVEDGQEGAVGQGDDGEPQDERPAAAHLQAEGRAHRVTSAGGCVAPPLYRRR